MTRAILIMEAFFCRSWQLGNILTAGQSAKNKRPWRAQSWVGRLYCFPSLQSTEITADCRANWRNGRTGGSGDCCEPVLFRHDRATVTATYSSCNCGYKRIPNAASPDSINSDGVLTKSHPYLRSYLMVGRRVIFLQGCAPWEDTRASLDGLHLCRHQQHWVDSMVYLF